LKGDLYFATWSEGDAPSPVVFTINKSSVEDLRKPVDDLRDPRMVTTEPEEVKELKLTHAGQTTLHLVRDPDVGFTLGELQPGYGVDYDTATNLIEAVTKAEATGYEANFKPDDEPTAVLTLTRRGTGLTETVRLYEDG